MKALDTSALLALLEGNPKAVARLRKWRGEEVATTEVNLLELAVLAARVPPRQRSARFAALARLRRRLTVLPIGPAAFDVAVQHAPQGAGEAALLRLAMAASLEASGCEELLSEEASPLVGKWRLRWAKL